ncbi:hypothetical protein HBI93_076730 [Parastagonospora nodorum]|nr:hypothetical protein HBI93_076730 [Parastagonospora nodorum]
MNAKWGISIFPPNPAIQLTIPRTKLPLSPLLPLIRPKKHLTDLILILLRLIRTLPNRHPRSGSQLPPHLAVDALRVEFLLIGAHVWHASGEEEAFAGRSRGVGVKVHDVQVF